MSTASLDKPLKLFFKTSHSTESFAFQWKIDRFSLSSCISVKTPNFCCFERRNWLGISNGDNWYVVMGKSHRSPCINFELVQLDDEEVDRNMWITARLLDVNGRIIRHSSQWKNKDFLFTFECESKDEISLYCLPSDILVIEWEMIRLEPDKHISTEIFSFKS